MKTRRWLVAASLVTTLSMGVPSAVSQEISVGQDTKGRQVFRDERPDDSRGWMIVTKSSYWPLAYEALDRLDATKELIGQSKPEELADSLDKVSAWLDLAASAAMTDGNAGIALTAELCSDAAESIRGGGSDWSDEKLTQLVTMAQLSMAKSHFMRAVAVDQVRYPNRGREPVKSDVVKAATQEIAAANAELAQSQYRFDNREAVRHLTVGRAYYQAACSTGGLTDQLSKSFDKLGQPPTKGPVANIARYFDEEISQRAKKGLEVVDSERKKLVAVLDE